MCGISRKGKVFLACAALCELASAVAILPRSWPADSEESAGAENVSTTFSLKARGGAAGGW